MGGKDHNTKAEPGFINPQIIERRLDELCRKWHANKFGGDSVELDALPASELRSMVREVIERHITERDLATLRTAEDSERELLEVWAADVEEGAAS